MASEVSTVGFGTQQYQNPFGNNFAEVSRESSSPNSNSTTSNELSLSSSGKDEIDIRPIHCGPQSESPASSTRLEVVETSDIEIIKNDSDDASGDMISSNQKLINTNGMSTLLSQYNHLQNTNNIACMDEKPLRQCGVCYDKATGLHYGIISCEGCKGFFKRAISNRRIYRCVNGDENCQMSRKDRNRCQFCRLKKCLYVGMNRKAIREDGMPGGRNKYTGPVNYTEDEVGDILSGREYANLPPLPCSSNSPRNQPTNLPTPNKGLLQLPYQQYGPLGGQMPYYLPQAQNVNSPVHENRAPKRRRSHASDMAGLPTSKMHSKMNEANLQAGAAVTNNQQKTQQPGLPSGLPGLLAGVHPVFQPIAIQIIDRLHEAEEKEILNFNAIWPAFKMQEKINKEQFLEAIPKIAEQSFTNETAWLRKAGLIDTIGVVDIFTLLSHSWQCLGLVRLVRYSSQLETFNQLVSKYEHSSYDMARFSEIYPMVLKIAQLYTKIQNMDISSKEYAIIKVLCVVNNEFSNGLETARQEVSKLQNLYLIVSRSVFGNERTIELLTVLTEIRLICSQMKQLDIAMMLLLVRIASATCWEMYLKNKATKEETCNENNGQTSPNPKSYESASPHSSGDTKFSRTSGDETENRLASISPLTFSPSTQILNASLAMHVQRQFQPQKKVHSSGFEAKTEPIDNFSFFNDQTFNLQKLSNSHPTVQEMEEDDEEIEVA